MQQCDKLIVDRRKCCQLCSTNDGPVHRTTVHLYQTALTTRCDDLHAVAKFSKYTVCSKVPEESALFWRHLNFPKAQIRMGRRMAAWQKPAQSVQGGPKVTSQTHGHNSVTFLPTFKMLSLSLVSLQ